MKRNGFTLVELLASLTILGILMAVTVPNVVGILNKNRETIYNEDARSMISIAKYKIAGNNNGVVKPALNQCVIMSLGYLDNGDYENPPNDGQYLREQSYVVVKKVAVRTGVYRYDFYARITEKLDNGSLFGIDFTSEANLEDGVNATTLSSINNVNVENSSLDKNYFKTKCGCDVITASYFKIDKKLDYE